MKAGVRDAVEKVEGVTRSWFEWSLSKDVFTNMLVVEVDWDTDPNGGGWIPFRRLWPSSSTRRPR
jgi:hypothetical protein